MLTLIDPNRAIPWVHPKEKDEDGTPKDGAMIFNIRPLSESQARAIRGSHPTRIKDQTIVLSTDEIMTELFVSQVAKIENVDLVDGQGKRVLSGPDDMKAFLDHAPPDIMQPIYDAIQDMGALTEGEVKNFGGSHGSDTSSAE